jgi:hypothetical protein
MKRTFALAGIAVALCSFAPAQENTENRVVVPARNSTRPRKVTAHTMQGPITVKTHGGREVIVETTEPQQGRSPRRPPATIEGMRRIDIPRGLSVEEQDNQINVRMSPPGHGGVIITVPADTSLDLQTLQGSITVEGVKGEIVVDSLNSNITLNNVGGNVLAHSHNGPIKATMDSVAAGKPLSFISFNGLIDVTLPADFKANVKMSTHNGGIYSDFDIRLGGGVITQSNNTADGKFQVRIGGENGYTGTINGGGAEATFKSYNGNIYIRKKP